MALNVKHHTILQAIMSRGPLSEEITHKMYKHLFKVNTLDGFNLFLGAINKELEFVDMEVKKVTDQNDGKEYFGIINKFASPQAKLGTRYSHAQIAFFKAVMETIVMDPSGEGYIQSARALNLKPSEALQVDPTQASASQGVPIKMTLGAKEEALELLVKDQWLSRTDEGGVSLGTRAYLELRALFRNLEVPFCEVCNEAAIKAELCKNNACSARMHSYCTAKKFRGRQAKVCSRCQTEWVVASPENGDSMENGHEGEAIQPEMLPTLSSRGRSRRSVTVRERQDTNSPKSQPSQEPQYSSRSRAPTNGYSDKEEENSEVDEEITRLDSDEEDRQEPAQRPKRRLRNRH